MTQTPTRATEALLKEIFDTPLPKGWVYVVCADIKDGWFDVITAYTNRAAAEAYIAWHREHSGDAMFLCVVPLEETWVAPPGMPQPTRAIKLVPLDE